VWGLFLDELRPANCFKLAGRFLFYCLLSRMEMSLSFSSMICLSSFICSCNAAVSVLAFVVRWCAVALLAMAAPPLAASASELDVPDAVIDAALGHKSPYPMADIYIGRNAKKVDEVVRRVIDYVKGEE
jgi:hypothetical protein